jgi:hypothetical protein
MRGRGDGRLLKGNFKGNVKSGHDNYLLQSGMAWILSFSTTLPFMEPNE